MNPTCITGKVCFPSALSARHFLYAKRRSTASPARRIYRCPICGHYHLTKHRPPFVRKRRPGQGYGEHP
jgi:DNA-directed RNA polymerase subunit RPC12/RpoP